jgi:glutamine amidotransferase
VRVAVGLVDLGLGNLHSVARAIERAGATPSLCRAPEDVARAERLVVPGQGAFRDCARALEAGFGDAIREALARGVPYFGICLGMQMLFEESDEAPGARGLGVFAGRVERFGGGLRDEATGERLKVPHMGWNEVESSHPWMPAREWFYFVHSYRCVPLDPACTVATADHGGAFCAAVAREGLFACQFHPEKSAGPGIELLRRFLG